MGKQSNQTTHSLENNRPSKDYPSLDQPRNPQVFDSPLNRYLDMLLRALTFLLSTAPLIAFALANEATIEVVDDEVVIPTLGRRNGNMAPHPALPYVAMPDNARPIRNGTELPPYSTLYYFDQLIDHNKPELGTFKQRYMFTWEYYEKGGPIILSTPGEANAAPYSSYLTNRTVVGQIAQPNHGAAVVLEHRFFGLSNPYPDLSSGSLSVLTLEQSTADLVYFAKNVHLPFPTDVEDGSKVGPDRNPWILVGGSYSGALVSWTMNSHPGVFHAGYSSSGVVQAISYYWAYFEPIRQYMPKNCSADVERVINYMDLTFTFGSKKEKKALRAKFGMPNVTHYDDVAGTLRNQLWAWQSLTPASGGGEFFTFCDALEVKNGTAAGPKGWGLEHALDAWGKYETQYVANYCQDTPQDECLGSYDSTLGYFHDTKVDNAYRSWMWFCCNEVGYWQDGAPLGWPSIVTRLVTPQYDERQCTYWFPEAFPTAARAKTLDTNRKYKGWDVNQDRLFFVNANKDPWREATVSSDFHRRLSTSRQPIHVLENGYHCSDLITRFNIASDIKKVQDTAVQTFTKWISEFVPKNKREVSESVEKKSVLDNEVMPPIFERDSTALPPVDATPPTVDLGSVNAGASVDPAQSGASPSHVAPKNAWRLGAVVV